MTGALELDHPPIFQDPLLSSFISHLTRSLHTIGMSKPSALPSTSFSSSPPDAASSVTRPASVKQLASHSSPGASTLVRKVPHYFSTKLVPALRNLGRRIATLGAAAAPAPIYPVVRFGAGGAPSAEWFHRPSLPVPVRPRFTVEPTISDGNYGPYDITSTPFC